MRCERCFIDEAGTFITMLDESRKQANIYSIEWQWDVDKPNPPKRKLEKVGEEENEGEMHSEGEYEDEDEGVDRLLNASKTAVNRSNSKKRHSSSRHLKLKSKGKEQWEEFMAEEAKKEE